MKARDISLELLLDGAMITIARGEPLRLLSADGLEAAEYALDLGENALLDGAYVVGCKVKPRKIELVFEIADWERAELYRHQLITKLHPKTQGRLIVARGEVRRAIGFYLSGRPRIKQASLYDYPKVTLSLTCPDPYFTDPQSVTQGFLQTVGLYCSPLSTYSGAGTASGYVTASGSLVINNSGDADIGIVVDINAGGGGVTNPRVSCDGQYVRVLTALSMGDSLRVSTVPGAKSIAINGVNSFLYDRASVFFALPPGSHTVSISADSGAANAVGSLTYSLKYLGV